jgi:uncharacterized SAM-binding protein YcdF (DUF218 family)
MTGQTLFTRVMPVAVAIMGIGAALLTAGCLYIYAYGQTDRATQPADVIIILGAGTRVDGSPNRAEIRRVRHAVALYNRGLAPALLCTGGITENHPKSEAQTCLDLARGLGVPAEALFYEDASTNTMENVIEARAVMNAHHFKTAIVVSDNFHLLRAEWLFREYSVPVEVSPAQATQGPLTFATATASTLREFGSFFLNGFRILWSDYRAAGKREARSPALDSSESFAILRSGRYQDDDF